MESDTHLPSLLIAVLKVHTNDAHLKQGGDGLLKLFAISILNVDGQRLGGFL